MRSPAECELVAHLRSIDPGGGTVAGTDHLPDSCQVIEAMGPSCRLAMSRGKDALAAWVHLRAHGVDVDPVHFNLVPGLEFIEADLVRLEAHFGCHITRLVHPSLPRMLRQGVFQPPARAALMAASLSEPDPTYGQSWDALDAERGPRPVAHGVRAADSQIRRLGVIRRGPVDGKGHAVVWDWRKPWWVETLRVEGLDLPVDYQWFGRSYDGVDARFLAPLREHAPADYRRVLDWFPLAGIGLDLRDEARHAAA